MRKPYFFRFHSNERYTTGEKKPQQNFLESRCRVIGDDADWRLYFYGEEDLD